MTTPRKNAKSTRGKPFAPGNPGRTRGTRNRATMAAEALLDGEADKLTRKAIEMALGGDTVALRLCLERLVPPRKERPITVDLPAIKDTKDHPAIIATIFAAVAGGDITPGEAQSLAAVLEQHRRSVEISEVMSRLEALEGKAAS